MVQDPGLPVAGALLDPVESAAMVGSAIEAAGGRLDSLAATQVRHRAGRSIAVRYRADVSWPTSQAIETVVLLADVNGLPEGAAVLADGCGGEVAVWTYPHDPFLPGLGSASTPERVRELLVSLGAADGPVRITPRVYRPTARAVLEVSGRSDIYLKVVPPKHALALHCQHERLAVHLPVPASYGCASEQGIVVLEARRGEQLGTALCAGRAVPPPARLLSLLDDVAGLTSSGHEAAPSQAAATYVAAIKAIAPHAATRAQAIADAAADDGWSPDRTIHGDFYEAQVLVDGATITGLLDVDRLGVGDALDDVATLLAHLDVLAWSRPTDADRVLAYRSAVAEAAADRGPADVLAKRVAIQVLGLATWPYRVQAPDWRASVNSLVDLAAAALAPRGDQLIGHGR